VSGGAGPDTGTPDSERDDMTGDYDVVVVGARVAGSMTALHLARAGHRVLVVDRAGPPADTLSTHILMRTAVVQLQRAGLLNRITDAPAITKNTLGFGGELFRFETRADFGVDALYAPRRTVLDPALLGAAVDAGVDVELGRSVSGLIRDSDDRVAGVVLGSGSDAVVVRSRYVVGADGLNSAVGRYVGASDQVRIEPTAASAYSYFAGMGDTGFDFRFGDRTTVGTVATNDGLTMVNVGVPAGELGVPEETFQKVLKSTAPDIAEAVAGAERVERMRFTPGIASFLRVPTGPGWVLVGDAGFTKDPLSAHGISCALRDAEFAADAIVAGLQDPDAEPAAGYRYRSTRDRFATPLLEYTAALASYRWTGAEASALMRALGGLTQEECAYLTGDRSVVREVA
jgi:menaquinone-9 beta-reductase